jgi:pyrroloquinoline quinone (PQQ) biosynthesis protein C
MKAPRSAAEILRLHEAYREKGGANHLYRFAEDIGVSKEELLGAALADAEAAKVVVEEAKPKPMVRKAKKVAKK